MPDNQWEQMLVTVAEEVLETMFFTGIYGPAQDAGPEDLPRFAAGVSFEGAPCGRLTLSIPETAARTLAADFLAAEGEGGLTDAQVGAVVCELANMICGALLSRVESGEHFRLSSPELVPAGAAPPACQHHRFLDLGEGALSLWLRLENHAA